MLAPSLATSALRLPWAPGPPSSAAPSGRHRLTTAARASRRQPPAHPGAERLPSPAFSMRHYGQNVRRSGTGHRRFASTSASNASPAAKPLPPIDGSFAELHRFASYANWLVPGELMLGRYPFIEPSRCRTRIQGEDQLRTILEAGVTIFCSLQAELPKQSELPVGGKDGFIPYKATVDFLASALSGPVPEEQHTKLRNPWLDKYLPERKRAAPLQENKLEPAYEQFAVVDRDVPSLEVLDQCISFIENEINNGKKVYLHCWGGRGRAGVVGACYLIKKYGVSADEALKRVQLAYDERRDAQRESPETEQQRQFVRDYAARVASRQ